jgi:hypothetical protein
LINTATNGSTLALNTAITADFITAVSNNIDVGADVGTAATKNVTLKGFAPAGASFSRPRRMASASARANSIT